MSFSACGESTVSVLEATGSWAALIGVSVAVAVVEVDSRSSSGVSAGKLGRVLQSIVSLQEIQTETKTNE